MLLRQEVEPGKDVAGGVRGVRGEVGRGKVLERLGPEMEAPARVLPHSADEKVALDGEEPGSQIPVRPAQVPAADRTLQAVLDEIVRRIVLAHERPRIAPEGRDVGLEEGRDVVHGDGRRA